MEQEKPCRMFNVRFQTVKGRHLLVQRNTAYEIDEVGLSIWELCDGGHTVEEIADAIVAEYDVSYDVALSDCNSFIEDLLNKSLMFCNELG